MAEERIQKIIARAGICSRREAEALIEDGQVTVNGRVARLGNKADAQQDHIKVKGKLLGQPEARRYILLYKPRQVMTTCADPEERTTVIDLVPPVIKERVFPVGRLDYHSEGLLILTNDGDLAARIAHPRYGLVREYLAKIKGDLDDAALGKLLRGTTVDGRRVVPLQAQRETRLRDSGNSWWRIEVSEGRTHEVRELFFRTGHPVQRLRRTAIGPIRDDSMKPGDVRELTEVEVRTLRRTCKRGPSGAAARQAGRSSGPRAGQAGDARRSRPKDRPRENRNERRGRS